MSAQKRALQDNTSLTDSLKKKLKTEENYKFDAETSNEDEEDNMDSDDESEHSSQTEQKNTKIAKKSKESMLIIKKSNIFYDFSIKRDYER